MLDRLLESGFEIRCESHAAAILRIDFPEALEELESSLADIRIPITEIIGSGGGEAAGTQRLRRSLAGRGWTKTCFEIRKTLNGVERASISHEIDHVKTFANGTLALEIEWNNKDPFFDRDLENFKRLHAEGGISAGIIVTRGSRLQQQLRSLVRRYAEARNITDFEALAAVGVSLTPRQRTNISQRLQRSDDPLSAFADTWAGQFVADKFGAATTHWDKLMTRVRRGVGNPCPLLLIGIPETAVDFNDVAADDPESADDVPD